MALMDSWKVLTARIEGLVRGGDLAASVFGVSSGDSYGIVRKSIFPELEAIRIEIVRFRGAHWEELPKPARDAIDQFLKVAPTPKPASTNYHPSDIHAVVPFAIFRTQFDFLLRDLEVESRNLTELAFEHLNRTLVVNNDVRERWLEAFRRREEHCERLGAVHLLSHGVWAFKVSGSGAATDLVYGEPIADSVARIRRMARAFVLTEWKLAETSDDLVSKAEAARLQTEAYAAGILGDLELKLTRYIVFVTRKSLRLPPDRPVGNVVFRHIGVVIDPDVPSKQVA